jgi:hypothetical protein
MIALIASLFGVGITSLAIVGALALDRWLGGGR